MTEGLKRFEWNAPRYEREVEWLALPWFQDYQRTEMLYGRRSADNSRTMIDCGAGVGRMLSYLTRFYGQVIAVDLNDNMFNTLEKRAKIYSNATAIKGDYTRLEALLDAAGFSDKLVRPVIALWQNSLGTTQGNMWEALAEARKVAEKREGEVILSVFNAEAFVRYGLELYGRLEGVVGPIDEKQTDEAKGIFVSKTGYRSQWFGPELRKKIEERLGGLLRGYFTTPVFTIIHRSYTEGV